MDDSRPSSPGAGAVPRKLVPPPALCGFLLLLALIFTVSYAVGTSAGPVAPGMHGTGTGSGDGTSTGGTGGGMQDMENMHSGGN
ncbi:hypothetical protein [Streptomyces sp. HGB0020]|jgi:hypothetical protein|uniref:hypothetical protein n=1 Tax=Streptomyces sp. HGB0020 TaxID=1078086 RepID=UPI00034E0369|nr:hypothetical protein [Streptomyces sp. HGB0020]EPD67256.1 hypothetical protein HMPREF1211_01514 [Streptomyces sp. HGB0020]